MLNKCNMFFEEITKWIAFDKVPQQRTDRRERVVVDGDVSNWKSVLSGVPQGSVLRPLLIYIYQ